MERKKLTKAQAQERDEIVFGKKVDWEAESGAGIIHFRNLDFIGLDLLMKKGYIDPEDSQNDSPTNKEFYDFIKKYPASVTAHGYVVSPVRDDERVSIEGIEVKAAEVTPELKDDFIDFCRLADDFRIKGNLYAWWD